MKIIAKKNKETQNNAMFYFLLTAGLTVAVLAISIICWVKLGWRWTDIFYIILFLACAAWSVWEGLKFFALAKISDNIIVYSDGKVNFFDEIVCEPKDITALSYAIAEDSKTGAWGELSFQVGDEKHVCPCVESVKIVYARLIKLGATPVAEAMVTEELPAEEEIATVEETAVEEVAVAEETVTEEVVENAEAEVEKTENE